jgi:hypothetical protein
MRRLTTILSALAILLSLGACGGNQPQQASAPSAPSLTVNFDLTIPLRGHRITGITLTPSGLPSGVVALQTVHDGRVITIGSQRFHRLNDTSFLAVQTSPHDIELGWNIQNAKSNCSVSFPVGSVWAGGSYGNDTMGAGDRETALALIRDVGKTSASGPAVSDVSAESVAASKKYPTETAYCVTIRLDEP